MRRVIAVDGTFLKSKYRGTLLAATAQDGDFRLYLLAYAIVDSENDDSLSWFFYCLRTLIPDAPHLIFISDRAPCIAKSVAKVYPASHHGFFIVHIMNNNIRARFGKKGLLHFVDAAANAYTPKKFHEIFNITKSSNVKLRMYLEDEDLKKWTRCYAPSNRYNIMTTNIAESLNSMLKTPREMPIISLLEMIRLTLTTWFRERRELAAKHDKHATSNVVKEMVARFSNAMELVIYQVDQYDFEVKDELRKYVVHLKNKQCTCRVFYIDKIPCIHAIVAAKRSKMDENKFVDDYYLTEIWGKAYAESIHPGGDMKSWIFPEAIMIFLCPPPNTKQSSGRPQKKEKTIS